MAALVILPAIDAAGKHLGDFHRAFRFSAMSLRAQRGNLVVVATAVRQRVYNLIEIATSLRSSQ
jgi:hypothetical protein